MENPVAIASRFASGIDTPMLPTPFGSGTDTLTEPPPYRWTFTETVVKPLDLSMGI